MRWLIEVWEEIKEWVKFLAGMAVLLSAVYLGLRLYFGLIAMTEAATCR